MNKATFSLQRLNNLFAQSSQGFENWLLIEIYSYREVLRTSPGHMCHIFLVNESNFTQRPYWTTCLQHKQLLKCLYCRPLSVECATTGDWCWRLLLKASCFVTDRDQHPTLLLTIKSSLPRDCVSQILYRFEIWNASRRDTYEITEWSRLISRLRDFASSDGRTSVCCVYRDPRTVAVALLITYEKYLTLRGLYFCGFLFFSPSSMIV